MKLKMDFKPIQSEEDHRAALAEIERLMDAQPETPEGDRLDALTKLVEAWEEEHYPFGERETRLDGKKTGTSLLENEELHGASRFCRKPAGSDFQASHDCRQTGLFLLDAGSTGAVSARYARGRLFPCSTGVAQEPF
jgi:hypothetical protein